MVFYHPLNLLLPVTVTATFFDPISGLPSPTDYVGFTPTDASDFTTTLIMRAYNSANVLIGTASRGVDSGGTYNPGVDTPVSLSFAGIARVELTGTVQTGANFGIEGDDFRFDTPAPVNTVPEPATWLLLGSSVAGLVWRKWVRRGNPGSEAA